MFHLQIENPKRGDWPSMCKKNLNYLKINLSIQEIKDMSITQYTQLVKQKCSETAYSYLMNKRGKKGSEIAYKEIQMAEYLLPNDQLSIEEQRSIFEIRNRMTNIPANFTSNKNNFEVCICKEKEEMIHLYTCKYLSETEPEVDYEKIYGDNVKNMKTILKHFNQNMKIKESILNNEIEELKEEVAMATWQTKSLGGTRGQILNGNSFIGSQRGYAAFIS